jgi:hypothetical protein
LFSTQIRGEYHVYWWKRISHNHSGFNHTAFAETNLTGETHVHRRRYRIVYCNDNRRCGVPVNKESLKEVHHGKEAG